MTIDEVWDAVMEFTQGGSYRGTYVSDDVLNSDIEAELDDNYDRADDATDAVEVAEDLLYDVLEIRQSDLDSIIDELNNDIEVVDYIEKFKDNVVNIFLDYIQ